MALSGSLQQISLEDVLRHIEQERRGGALAIRRGGLSARVYLDAGQILCTQRSGPGQSLGERLINAGVVTQQQLGQVRATARDHLIENEVDLARALWQANYLTREDLRQWVLADATELLVVLLRWNDGDLVFEEGVTPMPGRMVIPIPIALALDEALHHITQRRQRSSPMRVAVTRDLVLDFAEESTPEGDGEVEVSPDQWRFLTAIDGKAPLSEVAETLGMAPGAAVRLASELLAIRLLSVSGLDQQRPGRPAAPPAQEPPSTLDSRRPSGQFPIPGSSGSISAVNGRATRPPRDEQ
jgi:hypothetical protein